MQEFDFLRSLPSIAPEIGLTIMAVVVLGLDLYLPESRRRIIPLVTGISLSLIALVSLLLFSPTPETSGLYWGGMVTYDTLGHLFKVMVVIAGALTAFITTDVKGIGTKGEFYIIVIVSTLGGTLISSAADLIMIFLALETATIPLYILAAFKRDDAKSSESGMKYFLFGSFASGLLLYGLSLLYGFTGQTNLQAIATYLSTPEFSTNALPVLVALTLIIVGFGFKISAAPFHFWTPDVYEGAPTPTTAFLSVGSKSASFALLIRFLLMAFPHGIVLNGFEISTFWAQLAAVLAVASMLVGNLIALAQTNIKRLLAYSSIAQAGYTLIGIASLGSVQGQEQAIAAIAFYMFMYTFTNLLAFAVVIVFAEATGTENIRDFAGLSRRSPGLALALTIALLSLAGIPPGAGFIGKFFLFQAAVESGLIWLAIVGVLTSLVALYYYLMVIKVMYVDRSEDEAKPIPASPVYVWVITAMLVIVVLLGSIGVQPIFDWAARGAQSLLGGSL